MVLVFYWIINFPNSYKTHKYRYGRSIEDDEIIDEHEALSNAILDASLNDAEDCAKKLICSLNAKEVSTLASDESAIAELFGKSGSIDVSGIVSRIFDLTFKIKIGNFFSFNLWQTNSLLGKLVACTMFPKKLSPICLCSSFFGE